MKPFMKLSVPLVFVAAAWQIFAGATQLKPESLTAASPGEADPCAKTKVCLGVYLAPWCHYCQGAKPFVQAVRDRLKASPNVGVKIIVGSAPEEDLRAMAKEIGGTGLYLDGAGTFLKSTGARGVPQWITWTTGGKKLGVTPGAPGVAPSEGAVDGWLRRQLKLDEFM
jgi:hypothetical protein